VSYFVLYMSSPCLVGLAAEVNKTVKLSNCHSYKPPARKSACCTDCFHCTLYRISGNASKTTHDVNKLFSRQGEHTGWYKAI